MGCQGYLVTLPDGVPRFCHRHRFIECGTVIQNPFPSEGSHPRRRCAVGKPVELQWCNVMLWRRKRRRDPREVTILETKTPFKPTVVRANMAVSITSMWRATAPFQYL
jgi:hypothetical protein